MQRRQLLRQAAAMTVLSTGTLITHTAQAQSDSGNTKPISLIVGYSAGGSADLVARIVATEQPTHAHLTPDPPEIVTLRKVAAQAK